MDSLGCSSSLEDSEGDRFADDTEELEEQVIDPELAVNDTIFLVCRCCSTPLDIEFDFFLPLTSMLGDRL